MVKAILFLMLLCKISQACDQNSSRTEHTADIDHVSFNSLTKGAVISKH